MNYDPNLAEGRGAYNEFSRIVNDLLVLLIAGFVQKYCEKD